MSDLKRAALGVVLPDFDRGTTMNNRVPVTEAEKMRDQREAWPGMCIIDGIVVVDPEAELTGTTSKVGQRVDPRLFLDRDEREARP